MTVTVEPIAITQPATKHLHVSWDDYGRLGSHVAKMIHDSGWKFDQILCIARGGMFLGDQLSRILKKPLAVTSACSYDGEVQGELTISTQIAMSTKTLGKNLLLVDDLVDSGETLIAIKESVEKDYPGIEIRTAVIWKKTCSKFTPDYYSTETEAHVWIHQPFEKYDDVSPEDLA